MRIHQIYILSIFLFFISLGCLSQETSTQLKPLKAKDLIHFSIADKIPFKNDCMTISENKLRTSCQEKTLRDLILNAMKTEFKYDGEMYVFFTVDKKGQVQDIKTKGYPANKLLEQKIKKTIVSLTFNVGLYKNEKANIKCYTRLFPLKIN